MRKYSRKWNRKIYLKYLKEGRGQGEMSSYKPWITTHDFPSQGTISRVKGYKTGRIHHFMSNYELWYFYIIEWNDKVLDIREQYPLLDMECAIRIADKFGIRYPYDYRSGFPYVLTSDFMITTSKNFFVRTVKMKDKLENQRVLEKLKIEYYYWNEKGVDWKIVTDKEISRKRARKIEWINECRNFTGLNTNRENIFNIVNNFMKLYATTNFPILNIAKKIEEKYLLERGLGICILKYLIANKQIKIDMSKDLCFKKCRVPGQMSYDDGVVYE